MQGFTHYADQADLNLVILLLPLLGLQACTAMSRLGSYNFLTVHLVVCYNAEDRTPALMHTRQVPYH